MHGVYLPCTFSAALLCLADLPSSASQIARPPSQRPPAAHAGDYYWLGAAGTSFWNDPKQHLTVVFMMQAPSQFFHYSPLLRNMVYGALTEPEK